MFFGSFAGNRPSASLCGCQKGSGWLVSFGEELPKLKRLPARTIHSGHKLLQLFFRELKPGAGGHRPQFF
jgi:hypothetical protein